MRYYLADRIEQIKYGNHIIGVKAISLADDTFNEHFPGFPVFPGSLILEGAAQLAGSLFELTIAHRHLPQKRCVLSIVNRFKFRRPAYPGDRLVYNITIKTMQEGHGVVDATATIDGEQCAEGTLTFIFLDIKNEKLHRARMELYELWLREAREIGE